MAALTRGVLRVAEVPYTIAVTVRNRRYDRGAAEVHNVGVPIITVGNLTLGGTGKTPMVKWLAQRFQNAGLRVAIVSRGYGAADGKHNDEALELAQSLPNVPHIQNRDRVAAAQQAIRDFKSQLILLDDGYQHRRLGRDLDIVLLDALEPFGFEHVFPRGTLREPLAGLGRAHVVCLSRADAISQPEREAIRERVAQIAPQAAWCEAAHAASKLVNARGESQPLDVLAKPPRGRVLRHRQPGRLSPHAVRRRLRTDRVERVSGSPRVYDRRPNGISCDGTEFQSRHDRLHAKRSREAAATRAGRRAAVGRRD